MIETAPQVQAPAWARHAAWRPDGQAVRGIKEERPGGDDEIRPAFASGCRRPAAHRAAGRAAWQPLARIVAPADPTVLGVPSHGWEAAF